jgi:3-oxoacyl-[acyl-carrier protein] reductase
MQLGIAGNVALVSGSSRGIGRAVANVLHAEGCRLTLNARHSGDLDAAVEDLPGAVGVTGDVTRPQDAQRIVDAAVEKFGRLDIVVCNVGDGRSVAPGRESFDEWQRIFAINLWSATNLVEAAQEQLIASKGVIVCLSSICGSEVVPGAPVTYSAAKAALNAYVRGVARPLGMHGVRINAVAPGNVLFENSVWARKLADDPGGVASMLEREVALGMLGTPADVANVVGWLVSPLAKFVTGTVIVVDGGQGRSAR